MTVAKGYKLKERKKNNVREQVLNKKEREIKLKERDKIFKLTVAFDIDQELSNVWLNLI